MLTIQVLDFYLLGVCFSTKVQVATSCDLWIAVLNPAWLSGSHADVDARLAKLPGDARAAQGLPAGFIEPASSARLFAFRFWTLQHI